MPLAFEDITKIGNGFTATNVGNSVLTLWNVLPNVVVILKFITQYQNQCLANSLTKSKFNSIEFI